MKTIRQVFLNLLLIFLAEAVIREAIRGVRGEWGRRPR